MRALVWLAVGMLGWMPAPMAAEICIYGFEDSVEGWAIPDWAKMSEDHVGRDLTLSGEMAEEGESALKLQAAFPKGAWSGAYVEREIEVRDWTPFGRLAVSVYLPKSAPKSLGGRIILTIGQDWVWTEMNRAVPLTPGEWTTVSVDLRPGSMDWKFFLDDTFREDVRKLGVRIESDHGLAYTGPLFMDNVRLAE